MAKKRSRKKVLIFWGVLIVVLVLIGMTVFKGNNDEAVQVETTKVSRRTITQTVSAIGKIQPETEVKVSSETSGEIIFLGVEMGDTVKKGDLLVRIKPDIIQTQLEQSRAAAESSKMMIEVRDAELERAKNELKRAKELYEKEFISEKEFDAAKAAYKSAQSSYKSALANYEQAKASLNQVERRADRTTIIAPMDGIVTSLSVEEGEKVVGTEMMQGTEMMRISDLKVMNAVVEVDENDIVLVELGDTARIEIDALPEMIYTGKVVEIGHSAITSGLGTQEEVTNFEVKIRIKDDEPRLRPGMSCNVEIETETHENVLAVPLMAVTVRSTKLDKSPDVKEGGRLRKVNNGNNGVQRVQRPPSVVFKAKDNTAKMQRVETGISDKGFIEITSGLKEDDKIISGSFKAVSKELEDGSTITTKEKKSKFKK